MKNTPISKEKLISDYKETVNGDNKLKTILNTSIDGFYIVNKNGIITEVNDSFCRMSGYSKDELIGMNARNLTKKGSFHKLVEKVKEIQKTGEQNFEYYIKRKDKNILDVDFSVNFLDQKKDGEIFVFLRDITKRKLMEKKILDQKQELEKKNIALKEILSQIEIEKKQIKDNILINVQELAVPTLIKLKKKLSKNDKKHIELLETNLKNLTSSFASHITNKNFKLSPREIEICNMMKSGLSSKEIATILHTSIRTIENHRQHIRKKLNIKNQNINLTTYLQNF